MGEKLTLDLSVFKKSRAVQVLLEKLKLEQDIKDRE